MCTSFVDRRKEVLVAMNFDNNGMQFEVNTKNPKQFIIYVKAGKINAPSFGINYDGTFINSLMVDSNGKGLYKRQNKNVMHTSKLVKDILDESISPKDLDGLLKSIEIVNMPDFSVHCMISDKTGNVWVVEPGRGNIHNKAKESKYFVMTNFSLCDYETNGKPIGAGIDRYNSAMKLLEKIDNINVEKAFKILESVQQNGNEWKTDFSFVYSQKEKTVYYCFDRKFNDILKYTFTV